MNSSLLARRVVGILVICVLGVANAVDMVSFALWVCMVVVCGCGVRIWGGCGGVGVSVGGCGNTCGYVCEALVCVNVCGCGCL